MRGLQVYDIMRTIVSIVGQLAVDFLLVIIIENFSPAVTTEALQVKLRENCMFMLSSVNV